jgi:hypothetical protein
MHRQRVYQRTASRIAAALAILGGAIPALAQIVPEREGSPLPDYARRIVLPPDEDRPPIAALLADNALPDVLLTGYWPPTNEMIRRFSPDLAQNPQGWIGADWEERGYNVYAFFPEFPQGFGKGVGDFEVDYQDTSGDWWRIIPQVRPIAIMTFSRASGNRDWIIEGGNRTYPAEQWTRDYQAPFQPTPELPIMMMEPPYTERYSTQPMQAIVDAVRREVPTLNPFIRPIDPSNFLSNFIGYHGNWYHALHPDRGDPEWTVTGGHIHVGFAMSLEEAEAAARVSVRVLLAHLDARLALTADQDGDGDVDLGDYGRFAACLAGPGVTMPPPLCPERWFANADLEGDGDVDAADYATFAVQFGEIVE